MKQNVTELVDVILGLIQEQPEDRPVSETALRTWLTGQGYASRDIDAALKLVGPSLIEGPEIVDSQPLATRTYSIFEEYKLTAEARNALTRLELHGLIAPHERELILEHLGHIDGEVKLEELEYLISWLVCGGRDVEFQHTVSSVLEGREDRLH